MEPLPNVSIIVLVYNGEKFMEPLLDSLCQQTYPADKFEILFVDNASDDNSKEKVTSKKCNNVHWIGLGKNMGFAAGNNIALQYATHDYVAFLNQDTICHQEWLIQLVKELIDDPKVGACTSNQIICRGELPDRFNLTAGHSNLNYYNLTCFGYARYYTDLKNIPEYTKLVSGCSFITTKQMIQKWGYLFHEGLGMYAEDTDLSLRLINAGFTLKVAKNSIIYHLHGFRDKVTTGIINRVKKAIENRVLVYYMNMSTVEFILFYPFLLLGSPLKIFELSLSTRTKLLYFLPFSLFSLAIMVSTLFRLSRISSEKRKNLSMRQNKKEKFRVLKLLFAITPKHPLDQQINR